MEEADAVGESSGVPARELVAVEGIESTVMCLRSAAWGGRAVVLIWAGGYVFPSLVDSGDRRGEISSLCVRSWLVENRYGDREGVSLPLVVNVTFQAASE